MTCNASLPTLADCIRQVCRAASDHAAAIDRVANAAIGLEAQLIASQATLACVLTGGVGVICGGGIPSLAEAIDRLNAASIDAIAVESTTATGGQTTWTLGTAPDGPGLLQVAVNGATLGPGDYALSGAQITFTDALTAGDALAAWSSTL